MHVGILSAAAQLGRITTGLLMHDAFDVAATKLDDVAKLDEAEATRGLGAGTSSDEVEQVIANGNGRGTEFGCRETIFS